MKLKSKFDAPGITRDKIYYGTLIKVSEKQLGDQRNNIAESVGEKESLRIVVCNDQGNWAPYIAEFFEPVE